MRISLDIPREFYDEIDRRGQESGKRRVVLEALCKAWGMNYNLIPDDQRRKGSDRYEERIDQGWECRPKGRKAK